MLPRSLFNAGFYPQYLWDQRKQLSKVAGFDLEDVARSLATFHLTELHVPEFVDRKRTADENTAVLDHLVAVYHDLMRRGLPTLPSLFVERALLRQAKTAGLVREVDENGSLRFRSEPQSQVLQHEWQQVLTRGHVAVDPRLSPSDYQGWDSETSDAEVSFFREVLPAAAGSGLWQCFEAQRPYSQLVSREVARQHDRQRVDFAVSVPGLRAIIEVDGSQHEEEGEARLDWRRDEDSFRTGWRTVRVKTKDLHDLAKQREIKALVPDHPYVAISRFNQQTPLWSTELGRIALSLVLAPFGVARVQIALLQAIQAGVLSLRQDFWRLVVVERDVPCAALAVADFLDHLQAFYALHGIRDFLPAVELTIYNTAEGKRLESGIDEIALRKRRVRVRQLTFDDAPVGTRQADLMLDVAVLQRNGYCPPSGRFVDSQLNATGAAYVLRSAYAFQDVRRISPLPPMAYQLDKDSEQTLTFFVRNVFRKQSFRAGQYEIVRRSLTLQPVIGLLPTGAGKSLCYQLSALLQPGMTIVVDPIVSLMVDQVDNLKRQAAIDWIDTINSWKEASGKSESSDAMSLGKTKILFVSPERLQSKAFRTKLAELSLAYYVPYAVVDEAHCVSEWGHDFRTSYLRLADTMRQHARRGDYEPTVLALTGTASYAVLSDVQREIGVEDDSAQVSLPSFDRSELHFRIAKVPSLQKELQLYSLAQQGLPAHFDHPNWQTLYQPHGEATAAGIVFTPHVKGDYGAYKLQARLANRLNARVEAFTGQDDKDTKAQVQEAFKSNDFALLVATKSFGMGIDKPNIRYTVHYNIPPSLEAFYQEAGRAGRDRHPAVCWLLFSDDAPDEADRALDPNADIDVVTAGKNRSGGDVHRLLFLHQNSFCGLRSERDEIRDVYRHFIYPEIKGKPVGQPVELTIPFSDSAGDHDRHAKNRDKAIYRLRILGLVQDYTLDYRGRIFEVTASGQTDEQLVANLQRYVGRYKVHEVVEAIPSELETEEGDTTLGKCTSYLLRFVYGEIEKKRRAAIRSMAEVARKAAVIADEEAQDAFIRGELLAYLEKSPFTDVLIALASQIDSRQWLAVLTMKDVNGVPLLSTVDGVRQLVGGCRRTLESYNEHPGLLFLSSVSRLLLPVPDRPAAESELRRAVRSLALLPVDRREAVILDMLSGQKYALRNTRGRSEMYDSAITIALEENPTRSLARHIWPAGQATIQRLVLTLLLEDLQAVNRRLLTKD